MADRAQITFALAAATLALASPAGARTIDNWDVTPSGQNCTMVSTFADDVSIGLIWSPKTGELGFMATIPHPNDLHGAATAPLELSFDGQSPYTQWEDQHALVVTGKDGDALFANWGAAHSGDLAKAVGAASHVALRVGGKALGSYDLSGGSSAYRELTHCGSQLASR